MWPNLMDLYHLSNRLSLLYRDKCQGAYDEDDRPNSTDFAEDRFIAFAFLFPEKLLRPAADGPRKPRTVSVLQQNAGDQHEAGNGEQYH